MKANIKTKKGFTLIELLIVIAIIGILAVALLPQLLSAPASARDAAKLAAVSQISVALEQYNASSGGYPEADTNGDCMDKDSTTATKTALIPYFKNSTLPVIDVEKNFDTESPAPTTCKGYFYCKLAGNRYYLGVAMEAPKVAGKGRATLSPAGKLSGCNGQGAVPVTVTNVPTNAYGIVN